MASLPRWRACERIGLPPRGWSPLGRAPDQKLSAGLRRFRPGHSAVTATASDLMRGRSCCETRVLLSSLFSRTLCSWNNGRSRGLAEDGGWLGSPDESSWPPRRLALPSQETHSGACQHKAHRCSSTRPSTGLFPPIFWFYLSDLAPFRSRSATQAIWVARLGVCEYFI